MLPVVWSNKAKRNYADVIEYLSDFSVDAAIRLDILTEKAMYQISFFPNSFQISSKELNLRRCVIDKNYSAVYEVRENFVYVVSFKDNRSEKNK